MSGPFGLLLAVSLLSPLVGCGGGDDPSTSDTKDEDTGDAGTTVDVTLFELTVRIVLPLNQGSLFDDVDQLDIVVSQAGAEVGRYSLDALARGEVGRGGDDLPELDGATITLEGFDAAGTMVAYGESAPVSIVDGETADAHVFVARTDAFGWLYNLASGALATAVVADGTGDLLMFGGTATERGTDSVVGGAHSSVRRLDLGLAEEGLAFNTVGTMPTFSDVLDEHGRAGHTATRLGGTHDYADYILVAGGSTDFWDQTQVTDHAFLWDPATDSVVDTSLALVTPMSRHVAVADAAGNVVLSGGSTRASSNNSYTALRVMTFFNGTSLEMDAIPPPSGDRTWIHHAAARFGDRGVLLCGGYSFAGDGDEAEILDVCGVVSTSGAYTAQAESGITLPAPVLHHSMVGLADGSVLVTGGLTSTEGVLTVTNFAAVLDPTGTTWTEVGPMHMNRALHAMTLLPDGRVLVVGGVTEMSEHWWDGATAVACAELFNPELGDFTEVGSCTADAPDGDLPGPAAMPAVATDPVRGLAVVVGGRDRANDGATGVSVFMPPGG